MGDLRICLVLVAIVFASCGDQEKSSGTVAIAPYEPTTLPTESVSVQELKFSELSGREIIMPGETRPIRDFLKVVGDINNIPNLHVEVFDAHCGRGFLAKNGKMLADRSLIRVSAADLGDYTFTAGGGHNDYDELQFRLIAGENESEKRQVSVIAKGDPAAGLDNRHKSKWARDGRGCVFNE